MGVTPPPLSPGSTFPQLTHGYSIWVAISPLNVTGFFFHHVTRRRRNNSNRVSGLSCDIMHCNVGGWWLPWGTSHSGRRAVWRQWDLLPTSHSGGLLYRGGRHVMGWAGRNTEKRLSLGARRTLISFFIHFRVRWRRVLSNLWSKEEDNNKFKRSDTFFTVCQFVGQTGTLRSEDVACERQTYFRLSLLSLRRPEIHLPLTGCRRRWQRRERRLKN